MTVLPMPGTSSSKTCPSESSATSRRSMTSSLPTITRAILARMASVTACTSFKRREADSSLIQTQLLSSSAYEKSLYNAPMSVIEAISPCGQFLGELHHLLQCESSNAFIQAYHRTRGKSKSERFEG